MSAAIAIGIAVALAAAAGVSAADAPPFAAEVAPLLAAKCIKCHSGKSPKGDLNLTTRAGLLAGGAAGAAIEPGKPAAGLLLRYVRDRKMPPKQPLTDAEIDVLARWVAAGAPWDGPALAPAKSADLVRSGPDWWSWQPIARPAVPRIRNPQSAIRNPIDSFLLARLADKGLAYTAEADAATMIRRVTFDLTGLPPTPEEIDAYVESARAKPQSAYWELVERLLASPRFGEKWARHWLDVVRFAESDGFETNQPRPNAWPYRDYVIRSFNEDKPFDRFVREQIAGDTAGADEATGFLVGGPNDRVKSPDPVLTAQQRADELHDMVSTTAGAFLGLTVGCARCHDHKFDPIPQADYYALKAVFAGVQHGERPLRPAPDSERERREAKLRDELTLINAKLAEFVPTAHLGRTVLLDDEAGAALVVPTGTAKLQAGVGRGEADDAGDLERLPTLAKGYRWWTAKPGTDVLAWSPKVAGRFRVWVSWGCGFATHAGDARYVLETTPHPNPPPQGGRGPDGQEIARIDQRRFADGSGEPAGKPLWSGFRDAGVHVLTADSRIILRAGATEAPVTGGVLLLQEVIDDRRAGGVSPLIPDAPHLRSAVSRGENVERFPPVSARFVRFTITATTQLEPCIDELEVFTAEARPRNVALASAGGKATASSTLPGYAIHKLEHINDGRYGNERSWISNERGRGRVQIEFAAAESIDRVVWSRDRDKVPRYDDRTPTEYVVEASMDGAQWTPVASSADRVPRTFNSKVQVVRLAAGLSAEQRAEHRTLAARREEIEGALRGLTTSPTVYAGRLTGPEETRRLHRGDVTQPREPVGPGVLTQIGPNLAVPADASDARRRAALADWIADAKNPLTARVIVNRLWQGHFGRGLVDTPSDFGANGARPTHPDLLDWLAAELVNPQLANAWSLKHIHRLIVMSSAYRQASVSSDPKSEISNLKSDADNRLLWRFPPRRLTAEELRDTMLSVAGKLDLRMGGPGFDLFEPNGNYVKVYNSKRTFGPDTFRRMVYQSKPRMQLDDTFGAFDCPDAGQIAPKRSSSITPLQALNLLDGPFPLQQAQFFADRLGSEAGADVSAQVARAFRLAFGRPPTAEESAASAKLIAEHGLFVFCRAMLNANEFLFVR